MSRQTTPEQAELFALHRRFEDAINVLRQHQRDVRTRYNSLEMEKKPTFPTAEQRADIRLAIEAIRADVVPSSHHGDRVGAGTVSVAANRHWLSISHGAEIVWQGSGGRYWRFTDSDVEALLDVVRAEGVDIVNHWTHDTGLSVVVKDRG